MIQSLRDASYSEVIDLLLTDENCYTRKGQLNLAYFAMKVMDLECPGGQPKTFGQHPVIAGMLEVMAR